MSIFSSDPLIGVISIRWSKLIDVFDLLVNVIFFGYIYEENPRILVGSLNDAISFFLERFSYVWGSLILF